MAGEAAWRLWLGIAPVIDDDAADHGFDVVSGYAAGSEQARRLTREKKNKTE